MDAAAGRAATRRAALRLVAAGLGLAALRPRPVAASELGPMALALLAGRPPVPSPDLVLALPSIFEQGASLPLTVA
ncbi:MAG: hypothetical protein N2443_12205, partial [Blastocatellia bacterium]|nr:hypothetical protein [Blastocatellia bacterium]